MKTKRAFYFMALKAPANFVGALFFPGYMKINFNRLEKKKIQSS